MTELGSAVDNAVLGELRASVGDDQEFLTELVDEFLQDAPAQLESLRHAAISGDAAGATRAAHTLKGNSRTFGASELASRCQVAETAAGAGDLNAVLSHLDEINGEWGRVCAELLLWRDGPA
jgi:HPt (histidine-containing phosphotransfer) domain-containing protein